MFSISLIRFVGEARYITPIPYRQLGFFPLLSRGKSSSSLIHGNGLLPGRLYPLDRSCRNFPRSPPYSAGSPPGKRYHHQKSGVGPLFSEVSLPTHEPGELKRASRSSVYPPLVRAGRLSSHQQFSVPPGRSRTTVTFRQNMPFSPRTSARRRPYRSNVSIRTPFLTEFPRCTHPGAGHQTSSRLLQYH